MELFFNLQMFADAGTLVNATTGTVNAYTGAQTASDDMSPTMKTYYDTELLENARAKMVFSQLGKHQALPANHGDTVEWRKWNTFDRAMTPLTEGVIPTGQKFGQSSINVSVQQYGDYAAITDRLDLHAVDDVILGCTEEMGAAGGETADALVRNELVTGTSVIYADQLDSNGDYVKTPAGRYELLAENNKLTPDVVNKAYTFLKKQKAPFFEGNKYAAVIHPSVAYDLRSSKDWIEAHKYADVTPIFSGEIGELHGVRFIESTEAPVFCGGNLCGDTPNLTVSTYAENDTTAAADYGMTSAVLVTVQETLTDEIAEALVGRKIQYWDTSTARLVGIGEIIGATVTGAKIWLKEKAPVTLDGTANYEDTIFPGEGGNFGDAAQPVAVYGTIFFGKDAFGVVDPEGMGMELIVKEASQIGGPLNQFSTVGYKFESGTKILYQNRMVRVESCSAYSLTDEAN